MKNYPLLLLLFCATLFTTACSKDDEDPAPTKEEMVQNKRWQITGFTVSNILIGTIDYYASLESCQKDNYLEFKPGNVLLANEGATKCDPAAPQQTQGTWKIEGDVMTLSAPGLTAGLPVTELKLTIKELTATTLTADFNESISGLPVTGTVKMTAM
ncbi:hypothetical protein TH63_18320 [Rufibacter radiotolerans]|uniref:Lipocalin-like domain-containing protein n=1 Tax=Rufibacter radiotolerans TaxID=1379910 RepID=A0A0H4VTM6_9BACT|nr:lipocalin family protein [Rufibacter radiotolerans]AKQ47154.1 hypothetical protein TH63_18320 [Rufibacter radiotolerans]